jgi:capsular exopolysaccharide synthesis family protein
MYGPRLLNTYSKIATSAPVLEQLAQRLGVQKPPQVKVELPPNTELLVIIVEDRDPRSAAEAANTLAEILIARAGELSVGSGKTAQEILGERLAQLGDEIQQERQRAQGSPPSAGSETAVGARRSIELKEDAYARLLEQYERARLLDAVRANTISVVAPAVAPETPAKPRKALNVALALVVGVVAGTGLGFLFESLDTSSYAARQIGDAPKSSVLDAIPAAARDRTNAASHTTTKLPQHEAFGRLRTELASLDGDGAPRMVLITGAEPSARKSTTVANLAYFIARSGRHVAVVDGDLRLPTLHEIFGLRNDVGLSSVLRQEAKLDQALQDCHIAGIRVLTSGPPSPDPAELLASPLMTALMQELAERFDVVFVAAPATAVANGLALAQRVDGVVLCAS